MSDREQFFECTLSLDGEQSTVVVRAWDDAEALFHVKEDLQDAGLEEPADISVRPLGASKRPLDP